MLLILIAWLALAACSPAADPLATAPVSAPTNAPTGAPAITAQVATLVLSTAVLGAPTPLAAATAAATSGVSAVATAATIGGPIVITVVPSNGTPLPAASPVPATLIPTLPAGLSPSVLKFHVLAAYPDFFYCDPDFYPVARGDEAAQAEQQFPALQANVEEFQAILQNNNLAGQTAFNTDQKLLVYRAHKKLAALRFTLTGGQYQFQLQTKDAAGKGLLITGLIDGQGAISAQQSQPAFVTCPI
jgi:hypothetical protein